MSLLSVVVAMALLSVMLIDAEKIVSQLLSRTVLLAAEVHARVALSSVAKLSCGKSHSELADAARDWYPTLFEGGGQWQMNVSQSHTMICVTRQNPLLSLCRRICHAA